MTTIWELVPLGAAMFAVPQFAPQLRRSVGGGDVEGVSWSWAALTCVGNAAWTVYFAWSEYWLALVPSISASSMAAMLAVSMARSARPAQRAVAMSAVWAAALTVLGVVAGRVGLGVLLSVAFVVQVTPAVVTAYRAETPSGIAVGTWWLVLGELTCWSIYGIAQADSRLAMMGVSGVIAAMLMIARARAAGRREAVRDDSIDVAVIGGAR